MSSPIALFEPAVSKSTSPRADANILHREVVLCLQMAGLQVLSIRSDHSVQERNAAIDKFNNPGTQVDLLVTSIDLSAYGLNLHKCCCKGIILQWPWNANHLLQILGRLPRINQKRVVK